MGHCWGFVYFSICVHHVDLNIPSFIRVVVPYCNSFLWCFLCPTGPGAFGRHSGTLHPEGRPTLALKKSLKLVIELYGEPAGHSTTINEPIDED